MWCVVEYTCDKLETVEMEKIEIQLKEPQKMCALNETYQFVSY